MASKLRDLASYSSTKFSWTIQNFSKLDAHDGHESDVFCAGSINWAVKIYPKGLQEVYEDLTLELVPIQLTKPVEVRYSFAVTSRTDPENTKKLEGTKFLLPVNCTNCWGWSGWTKFMPLSDLHDPEKGYLVNDTCIIEVEVTCRMRPEGNLNQGNSREPVKKKDDADEYAASDKDKKKDDASGQSSNQVTNKYIASTQCIEYPGAGQPFEEGQHYNKAGFCEDNQEYEDVGGFSILKTQAPLYKQIWLKYGHIPSTKVMPIASYPILVMVVKELLSSITDMRVCHYVDLSSEMIERWEGMISMAEKFEFNIGWLRERFEHVIKGMCGMQNVKTELLQHGQHLRATKSKMWVLRNVMTKVEAELIAKKDDVRGKISGLLSKSDMETYLEIGEDTLLAGLLSEVY